jgi:hypothetical protein
MDANRREYKAEDRLFDDTPMALLRRATPPKLAGRAVYSWRLTPNVVRGGKKIYILLAAHAEGDLSCENIKVEETLFDDTPMARLASCHSP